MKNKEKTIEQNKAFFDETEFYKQEIAPRMEELEALLKSHNIPHLLWVLAKNVDNGKSIASTEQLVFSASGRIDEEHLGYSAHLTVAKLFANIINQEDSMSALKRLARTIIAADILAGMEEKSKE